MWGAIIQAIPAVIQMVKGGEQKAKGEAGLASLKRPEYYDTLSRMGYGDKTMPGEVNMLDRNDLIAQNAYKQAMGAGNPLAMASNVQAMNQKGAINIGTQSAQHRERDAARLQSSLATEFQMNQFAPYAEKSQEYRDMVGAGEKNQFAGISNMAGIASTMFSNMDGAGGGGADTSKYDANAAGTAGDAYKSTWGMDGTANVDPNQLTYEQYLKAKQSGFGTYGMYKTTY